MNSWNLPDGHDLGHLRSALRHFDRRRLAVDGGAHRGIWTRELANHFDSVIAFEPRSELAKRIGCGTVVEAALGDRRGRCAIAEGPENNGQGHVVPGESIPVETLDLYGVSDLDFLKLDVEGYELPALKGAEKTILRCTPAIMVEMNGLSERYGYTDADLGAWLTERGYQHVARYNKDHLWLTSPSARARNTVPNTSPR